MPDGIAQLLIIALVILVITAIGFGIYHFAPRLIHNVETFMNNIIGNSTDKATKEMQDEKKSDTKPEK